MAASTTELLQGTLDLRILKAISPGPLHGYGVLLRKHMADAIGLVLAAQPGDV